MSVTRADSLIVSTMSRVAGGSVDESLCLGRLYQIPGSWFSSLNSPFVECLETPLHPRVEEKTQYQVFIF